MRRVEGHVVSVKHVAGVGDNLDCVEFVCKDAKVRQVGARQRKRERVASVRALRQAMSRATVTGLDVIRKAAKEGGDEVH